MWRPARFSPADWPNSEGSAMLTLVPIFSGHPALACANARRDAEQWRTRRSEDGRSRNDRCDCTSRGATEARRTS